MQPIGLPSKNLPDGLQHNKYWPVITLCNGLHPSIGADFKSHKPFCSKHRKPLPLVPLGYRIPGCSAVGFSAARLLTVVNAPGQWVGLAILKHNLF